ncbi:MAG TPA: uracil-DNA glycosylase [Planctomycetota bacterium]
MDAREYFPPAVDLDTLREAARACKACGLWKNGTQTVFGEGPGDARLFIVGERPDVQDDRAGEPFVGEEGRLLDRALEAAGLPRDEVYVTQLVKHLKAEPPRPREIRACLPWLEAEIDLIRPDVLVCLGETAARALAVKAPRWNAKVVATLHPATILRQPTAEAREADFQRLAEDLRNASRLVR